MRRHRLWYQVAHNWLKDDTDPESDFKRLDICSYFI